jgi:hypothetical protein
MTTELPTIRPQDVSPTESVYGLNGAAFVVASAVADGLKVLGRYRLATAAEADRARHWRYDRSVKVYRVVNERGDESKSGW